MSAVLDINGVPITLTPINGKANGDQAAPQRPTPEDMAIDAAGLLRWITSNLGGYLSPKDAAAILRRLVAAEHDVGIIAKACDEMRGGYRATKERAAKAERDLADLQAAYRQRAEDIQAIAEENAKLRKDIEVIGLGYNHQCERIKELNLQAEQVATAVPVAADDHNRVPAGDTTLDGSPDYRAVVDAAAGTVTVSLPLPDDSPAPQYECLGYTVPVKDIVRVLLCAERRRVQLLGWVYRRDTDDVLN